MQLNLIDKFGEFFADLTQLDRVLLNEIYTDNVVFTDSVHHMEGLDAYKPINRFNSIFP